MIERSLAITLEKRRDQGDASIGAGECEILDGGAPMNPIARLARELRQLARTLDAADFARYLTCVARTCPAILETRSLVPADRLMTGNIAMKIGGKSIVVPVSEITEMLEGHDPTPTFGMMRELFAGNVYLAPFDSNLKARNVVDLGSNRGLFSVLSSIVLDAEMVVGVEPSRYYQPVLERLIDANSLQSREIHRIVAFASSVSGDNKVTMDEILQRHGMDRINFLKCDIEGGEFDLFLRNNAFLSKVDNIGMELHSEEGDIDALCRALVEHGFRPKVTDQFGNETSSKSASYLFAIGDQRH